MKVSAVALRRTFSFLLNLEEGRACMFKCFEKWALWAIFKYFPNQPKVTQI